MRYRPQTPNPRFIGSVESFDIYVTPMGNIIARYGDDYGSFLNLGKVPYEQGRPHKMMGSDHDVSIKDRIDALMQCFAADLCE